MISQAPSGVLKDTTSGRQIRAVSVSESNGQDAVDGVRKGLPEGRTGISETQDTLSLVDGVRSLVDKALPHKQPDDSAQSWWFHLKDSADVSLYRRPVGR